uniref:Uncharacterized protein n=1 Tax=Roseihalotalea indica TaxID=2867963 RepID=A0AA49GTS4_9BACT|nr:hypothetical protein K4G66_10160 [Tunicatimonas sp. TK19036]
MQIENIKGLIVLVSIGREETQHFVPAWTPWLQHHFPQWAMIDIDNRSDPMFLSYVQKAMTEHKHTLFLIDIKTSEEEGSLGGVFSLLQQVVRDRANQPSVILHGKHGTIEKMGRAFQEFYQALSEEETKKTLNLVLGRQ